MAGEYLEGLDLVDVADFGPFAVTNSVASSAEEPFDPVDWIEDVDSATPPNGDVYEHRLGFPIASYLLDRQAPQGAVVLNEDPAASGIFAHRFAAYADGNINYLLGSSDTEAPTALATAQAAIRIATTGDVTLASVGLLLRRDAGVTNTAERLALLVFSDAGGVPGAALISSASAPSVAYGDIPVSSSAFTTQTTFAFSSAVVLDGEQPYYWLVLIRSATPVGGSIYLQTKETPGSSGFSSSADGVTWSALSDISATYQLRAAQGTLAPLPSINVLEDPLGRPLASATQFGGANDEGVYEAFGTGRVRSLTKYLEPDSSGLYPLVSTVEVGFTADSSKSFVLEVRADIDSAWVPLLRFQARDDTRPFFPYTFKTAMRLFAIRARYEGDAFSPSEQGTISLAATDTLSGVTHVQLSRLSDFSDAAQAGASIGADSDGWLPYAGVSTLIDWALSDRAHAWRPLGGAVMTANAAGFLVSLPTVLLAVRGTQVATTVAIGPLTTRFTLSSAATAACLHNNLAVIGNAGGQVVTTAAGESPLTLDTSAFPTSQVVTALCSHKGVLYAAVGKTSPQTNDAATLWRLPTGASAFVLERTFDEPMVTALMSAKGYLFAATAGAPASGDGHVYVQEGVGIWSRIYDAAGLDAVDVLGYSDRVGGKLLAGLRGGKVTGLSFDAQGNYATWDPLYAGEADRYLQFMDDPGGDALWIVGDTAGLTVVNTTGGVFGQVQDAPAPAALGQGLAAVWTNATSATYLDTTATGPRFTLTDGPIAWPDLTTDRPIGVNPAYFNARWTGWIQAAESATHTLFVDAPTGDQVRLIVDGLVLIDDAAETPSGTERQATTEALTVGQWYAFVLEYCHGNGGATSVALSWTTPTTYPSKTPIPVQRLNASENPPSASYVLALAPLSSRLFALGGDGGAYSLSGASATALLSPQRAVYARFRDRAGNETSSPGATDTITVGAEIRAGQTLSRAAIYQVENSAAKTVKDSRTFNSPLAVRSPNRTLQATGLYTAEPFHAVTLSRWDQVQFSVLLPKVAAPTAGLDWGVSVEVYVRTGATRDECLAADWGLPYAQGSVRDPAAFASDQTLSASFDIFEKQGAWLQWQAKLITASQNISPRLLSFALTYRAAEATYWYSRVFDTAEELSGGSALAEAPQIRRFIATANMVQNGGRVTLGYLSEPDAQTPANDYDFSKWQAFEPNRVVTLPVASSRIRFGALLITASDGPIPTTITVRPDVRAASAAEENIASFSPGPATLDGVPVRAGDRLLLTEQTSSAQNGVYVVQSDGSWTRAADSLATNAVWTIRSGLTRQDTAVYLATTGTITVGTTALTFVPFTPAILDDFAVLLDCGEVDLSLMS